uniref:NTF2 domain-containing protein n=1 Tax=Panagrolaimus sp. ES5 TaxID=591445 RepID=A0AC34F2J8_9BILA
MATKDYCLSFKDCVSDNLSDDKYNNLNLNNQNQKSAIFQTLTTKRVSTDSKKFQTYAIPKLLDVLTDSRKGPNSWKKSSKNLTSNLLNADRDLEENEFKKAKNGINSSTLSLHIAAYENSNEASNFNKVEKEAVKQKGETLSMPKKWGISNHFVGVPTSTIQNPFEFPRQQDDQASRSDLMQFTASQRLLNPNQMDSNNQVKPPSMEPNDDPAAKKNAKEIGIAFVKKYYEAAIQGLDVIMELFGDCSVYVGANGKEARGLKDIRNALSKLNLQEGKILIVSMNAAFTENGGIMVQCLANYITDESSKYGFSESFHLVPQSKGWYVRSCLFKWHDETPENAKSEDSETLPEDVEQEHKHELVNDHTAEDKESTLEADVKAVAEELTKLTCGLNQPKSRNSANGTTAPPSTPTKNDSAPEKDT